jgi:hypothetical protein
MPPMIHEPLGFDVGLPQLGRSVDKLADSSHRVRRSLSPERLGPSFLESLRLGRRTSQRDHGPCLLCIFPTGAVWANTVNLEMRAWVADHFGGSESLLSAIRILKMGKRRNEFGGGVLQRVSHWRCCLMLDLVFEDADWSRLILLEVAE